MTDIHGGQSVKGGGQDRRERKDKRNSEIKIETEEEENAERETEGDGEKEIKGNNTDARSLLSIFSI